MITPKTFPIWLKAVLALAMLGIGGGGAWFYHAQEQHLHRAAESELEAITELKALKIAEWRRQRLRDAEQVRSTLQFTSPPQGVPTGPHSEQTRQRLAEWLTELVDGTTYHRALLVDDRLNVGAAGPLPPVGEVPALSAVLRGTVEEAIRTGEAVLTDLHRPKDNGPVQLAVVIPLGARSAATNDPVPAAGEEWGAGALILESHAGDFLFSLLQFWPTPAETAETLLVRRDGGSVLYLNDLRFRTNTALNLRAPLSETNRLAVKAVLGQEGLTHGVDYRGELVVAVLKAIPDSPWFIESKLDEAEAFAVWRTRSKLILALVLGSLIAAGGGAALVWQRWTKDHFESLYISEAALRASQENYRLLVDTVAEGIWRGDAVLRTTFVNKRIQEFLGRPAGELLGVPLRELLHPEDAARISMLASFRPGQVEQFESRISTICGRLRWVLVSLTARGDAQERPVEAVATITDITDLKTAQIEVSRQAALLDAANDAIYVRTLDHKVIYWNGGAARLYGYCRAEAMGRDIRELGLPNNEAFAAAEAELLKQGRWSGELQKHNKDGQEVAMFCRWTLLRDGQSWPEAILSINTDITEKKKLEEQLLRSQRMETLGVLAGGIAHDLNNVLAPVLMGTSLLRESLFDPENRAMLDNMEASVKRGANIIKQLLIFARGKPHTKVIVPLRKLLGEMQKFIEETFPRRIRIVVTTPRELWPVMGDATQLHQAILNLCINARDAMTQGGTLILAAQNVTVDEDFARVLRDARPGDYVSLSVSDTGAGIAPEHLERIFEPFFTTKEVGQGTGLGLATVLGLVRGHGGFVRVDSRVGHGSAFELYFPVAQETGARAHDTAFLEAPPPRGQNQMILVVDDEAAVRRAVQLILTRHGYRVLTAAQGAEALALFTQHRAEVRAVVTDMMMPGMDGSELTRRLWQLDERLPILGMSGLTERVEVQRHEHLPLAALLAKPFPGVKLLAALHAALAATQTPANQGPRSNPKVMQGTITPATQTPKEP